MPHGLAAVRAGIPMLVEKPLSDELDSAMRLVAAAEAAGVPILVGHHRRHSPLVQRARGVIDSGRLGRITAVTGFCLLRKPGSYFEGAGAWRGKLGGGMVLINLVHVVDDLRNMCGDIVGVQAAGANAARGLAVDDTVAVVLRFAGGALGTLTASDATPSPWSWEMTAGEHKDYPSTDQSCYVVAGTRGSLTVPRLDVWTHEGEGWHTPLQVERSIVPEQDPLTIQTRHFCAVVSREVPPLLDGRGGARTLETTLAIQEAAQTGQVVRLG